MSLTHFNAAGHAAMVDVAGKPETERLAVARGRIVMAPATLALIAEGRAGKGDASPASWPRSAPPNSSRSVTR